MLIFQKKVIATLGYPQPAIRTPLTVAVPIDLNRLARTINIGLGQYGAQYIYSNGVTAYNLLKNISSEEARIQGWRVQIAQGEARQGVTRYRRTSQYRSLSSSITTALARIDNYRRQLTRLVVYVNPRFPTANIPVFSGAAAAFRSPYFDQFGRPLFDNAGRPYFDQFGRPYPYTPHYYFSGGSAVDAFGRPVYG